MNLREGLHPPPACWGLIMSCLPDPCKQPHLGSCLCCLPVEQPENKPHANMGGIH